MKKLYFVTLLFLGLLLISCEEPVQNVPNGQFEDQVAITSRISAHRGGKDIVGYAENSLRTIQYLHKMFPGMMYEVDLQPTSDGRIVLFHDDALDRLTGKSGRVDQLDYETLSEIPLLDHLNNETACRIPLLDDVLEWAADNEVTLWLDFKPSVSYAEVINMVREYNAVDNVILIAYTTSQAEKLQSLAPEMLVSMTARNMKEWGWLQDGEINLEKAVIFTGTVLSDPELLDAIHESGVYTVLGTLGNLDKRAASRGDHLYREWVNQGYDLFSSDRAEEIWKALYDVE